jgi:STE24 endopeptidase
MSRRRRLWLLALCLPLAAALYPLAAQGAIEPRLLRYFTPKEVLRHDAYLFPLYAHAIGDFAVSLALQISFLLFRLNARLLARCDLWARALGARLVRVGILRRLGAVLTLLWGDAGWGGALLFVATFFAVLDALGLPTGFYFGYLHERRHGLGVQSVGRWFYDYFKAETLAVMAHGFLVFGLYGLARRKDRWWLWLGIPSSVLLLGAGILDPYRVQIMHDYLPLPEGRVRQSVVEVLQKAKVEYQDVCLLKMKDLTRRADAFVIGQGPSRRVVLFDTFATAMTPDEVANGVAHELGHIGDRSPGRIWLASATLLPSLYLLARLLRWLGRGGRLGFTSDRDVASLPVIYLAFALVWYLAAPLSSAYSRHLERRADDYALELLRQPEAFRALMVKLVKLNMADVHPPLYARVLSGHPLAIERIERAETFARRHALPMAEPNPAMFQVPEASMPTPP